MNSLITRIKTHLGENKFDESESIKEMKKEMLSDFNTRYQDEKVKKILLISSVLDPRNKELLADLNTRELVINKISSIVQSNNSNTQVEVVPCTQGQ